mgnify:CR=1 FL=1
MVIRYIELKVLCGGSSCPLTPLKRFHAGGVCALPVFFADRGAAGAAFKYPLRIFYKGAKAKNRLRIDLRIHMILVFW